MDALAAYKKDFFREEPEEQVEILGIFRQKRQPALLAAQ